ncbi:hypothetical protein L3Q82_012504 [Scortum barcoo]|uniref:Uncharacterized protein n=1 Tax=Scortum barcoo TaxID=214431 RepID=A0ACB8W5X9_9TELE|nr:hypothetical protein L3Q82_012504 [Scortum barcoo]
MSWGRGLCAPGADTGNQADEVITIRTWVRRTAPLTNSSETTCTTLASSRALCRCLTSNQQLWPAVKCYCQSAAALITFTSTNTTNNGTMRSGCRSPPKSAPGSLLGVAHNIRTAPDNQRSSARPMDAPEDAAAPPSASPTSSAAAPQDADAL